jgi:hypothetical protein
MACNLADISKKSERKTLRDEGGDQAAILAADT